MEKFDYKALSQRMGAAMLKRRFTKQVKLSYIMYTDGFKRLSLDLENKSFVFNGLANFLRLSGQYTRGLKNTLDYRVIETQVPLLDLPDVFDGFRIVQLTDLHADSIIDQGEKLIRILKNIPADLFVITGDFRTLIIDVYHPALRITGKIIQAIRSSHGIYGVLGNHDFIEFVPELEAFGMRLLLNEGVPIRKGGQEFWLLGVDDAHYYQCHDIQRARCHVPPGKTAILLSHTPSIYRLAENQGIQYCMCGHTHGGQMCLPGGTPVITHARSPRSYSSGSWSYKLMKGYTSRGVGSSGLPVRYGCPPEITIHELVAV